MSTELELLVRGRANLAKPNGTACQQAQRKVDRRYAKFRHIGRFDE